QWRSPELPVFVVDVAENLFLLVGQFGHEGIPPGLRQVFGELDSGRELSSGKAFVAGPAQRWRRSLSARRRRRGGAAGRRRFFARGRRPDLTRERAGWPV